MALKTFKPYTKSTSSLWKGSPYKPLTKGQILQGEEIITVGLLQDILVVVLNINSEL